MKSCPKKSTSKKYALGKSASSPPAVSPELQAPTGASIAAETLTARHPTNQAMNHAAMPKKQAGDPPHVQRRIIRMSAVCEITSLKKARVHALIASHIFPPPFKIVPGGHAAGWWEHEIFEWLEKRSDESRITDSARRAK